MPFRPELDLIIIHQTFAMGIPQGSVIAPILFNILMQYLLKILFRKVNLLHHADHISTRTSIHPKSNTNSELQNLITFEIFLSA